MSLLSKIYSTLYRLFFTKLRSIQTATHFQDVTCSNIILTNIHTFSKGLSYLRICELREPKCSMIILIYLKTTTY